MSTPKAADLVARMQRLGAGAPAAATMPPGTGGPPGSPGESGALAAAPTGGGRRRPGRPGVRAVRCTVDLDPELHRALRLFALQQRVDASEVVRNLLELLDDESVRALVVARLGGDV